MRKEPPVIWHMGMGLYLKMYLSFLPLSLRMSLKSTVTVIKMNEYCLKSFSS